MSLTKYFAPDDASAHAIQVAVDLSKRCDECARKGVSWFGCTGFPVPPGVKADLCEKCFRLRCEFYWQHEKAKSFRRWLYPVRLFLVRAGEMFRATLKFFRKK